MQTLTSGMQTKKCKVFSKVVRSYGNAQCPFLQTLAMHLLWRYGKNWHITSNISECPGPTLTYFKSLVGILVGKIFQIFVWRTPKGRCYGNQLNMGDVRKRHVERPSLFASAFENRLADRKSAFKRFNGNNHPVKIW